MQEGYNLDYEMYGLKVFREDRAVERGYDICDEGAVKIRLKGNEQEDGEIYVFIVDALYKKNRRDAVVEPEAEASPRANGTCTKRGIRVKRRIF